jgi:ABC-type glycerol-3-phosphate transport system permease component
VGNQRVSGRRPRPKSWLWPSMRLLSLVIWLMRSFFDATLWALEEAA